jgi:hypothetical protein
MRHRVVVMVDCPQSCLVHRLLQRSKFLLAPLQVVNPDEPGQANLISLQILLDLRQIPPSLRSQQLEFILIG